MGDNVHTTGGGSDGSEATAEAQPAASEAQPPRAARARKRAKRRGGGNAARDARRAERAKRAEEARAQQLERDPFAEPARAPEPEAPADGGEAGGEGGEAQVDGGASAPVEEAPQLGVEGARAMAPAYYGLINFGTSFLIKRAPAFAGRPQEAARVVAAMKLDGRGHYDAAGQLVNASEDREAIDPALIPVLAKLRLTPEWALLIITGGILLSRYAAATGDAEVMEALQAMNPMGGTP